MTHDEFAFWEKAFLAALGCQRSHGAEQTADAALAVWRAKCAEVEREHVEKVVTIIEGEPGKRFDGDVAWAKYCEGLEETNG